MPLLAAAAELSDLDRWGALLEDWSGGDVVGAEPWRRFGSAACGARFNTFQEWSRRGSKTSNGPSGGPLHRFDGFPGGFSACATDDRARGSGVAS